MTEATGFLFVNLQKNFDKLISYFNKIFKKKIYFLKKIIEKIKKKYFQVQI